MQAVAEQTFIAELPAPADVTELGARIEVPVTREIVAAYTMALRLEAVWRVELVAPPAPGDYLIVWRTPDPEPPFYESFVPLTVTTEAAAGALGTDAWTPSLEDVARLVPAYTRTAIDAGGTEQNTFTSGTNPTADEVAGYITAAVREITGRVGTTVPLESLGLAQTTAAWHVAAAIEAEKSPSGADETDGAYRWKQASYVACLKELVEQARRGPVRLA